MTISIRFHIVTAVFGTGKTFRFLVEHYYSSDQVERFKVFGKNERFVAMEKRLQIHKQPWKIIEGNIDTTNVEVAAMAIKNIQDALDDYLKAKKLNNYSNGYVKFN